MAEGQAEERPYTVPMDLLFRESSLGAWVLGDGQSCMHLLLKENHRVIVDQVGVVQNLFVPCFRHCLKIVWSVSLDELLTVPNPLVIILGPLKRGHGQNAVWLCKAARPKMRQSHQEHIRELWRQKSIALRRGHLWLTQSRIVCLDMSCVISLGSFGHFLSHLDQCFCCQDCEHSKPRRPYLRTIPYLHLARLRHRTWNTLRPIPTLDDWMPWSDRLWKACEGPFWWIVSSVIKQSRT